MTYLGLKEDGLYKFAAGEEKFIEHYEKKWNEVLTNIYYSTNLLDYGHKFRPRLVYWGYCAGKNFKSLTENDYDAIALVSVSIELVHKASILLDDYIDGDTARHGMEAFHITYGPERTMMFALNILCKALEIINNVFIEYINDSTYSKISMQLVIQTLEDMSLGVLKELDLSNDISMQKYDNVKEIMHLETSSLITNSLLIGYLLSQNTDLKTMNSLQEIGSNLGYIFQILNDLEPFCSPKNNEHKGSLNTDISRNRKNICLPLLYSFLSTEEKKVLEESNMNDLDLILLNLFTKYNIKEKSIIEINSIYMQIYKIIEILSTNSNIKEWCTDFHEFVDSVIAVSKKRLQ